MQDHPDAHAEAALIAQARAGDPGAFDALVEAHQRAVFRFARALTHNDALAEDVLQETFLSALEGLGAWRAESSLRTWLLVIARNAALKHRRRDRERPGEQEPDFETLGRDAGWGDVDSPERIAASHEAASAVTRALASLDVEAREVLTLRELEGLSGDETARLLGLSLAAMKSRLHRARLAFVAALRAEQGHHAR